MDKPEDEKHASAPRSAGARVKSIRGSRKTPSLVASKEDAAIRRGLSWTAGHEVGVGRRTRRFGIYDSRSAQALVDGKGVGISDLRRGHESDGLHEAEARVLDGLDGGVLLLHEGLVLLLELGNFVLEVLLGGLLLGLLLLDGGVEVRGGLGLELLDLGLGVVLAEVDVGQGADRRGSPWRRSGGRRSRGRPGSPRDVGVAVLDGREATNTVGVAERLAGGGAVNVSNESGGVAVVLGHELIPVRLHALAVASPRREELDEDSLASGVLVPIVRGELGGGSKARVARRTAVDLNCVDVWSCGEEVAVPGKGAWCLNRRRKLESCPNAALMRRER